MRKANKELTVRKSDLRFVQPFVYNFKLSALRAVDALPAVRVVEDARRDIFYIIDGSHRAYVAFQSGETLLRVEEGWMGYPIRRKYYSESERLVHNFFEQREHNPSIRCPFVRFEDVDVIKGEDDKQAQEIYGLLYRKRRTRKKS